MSRLTKTQIYAIQWLNSQNVSNEEIANDLAISENQVLKTLERKTSSKSEETKTKLKTKKSPANLMISETSGKKNKHVAIMTKEASEMTDSLRDQISGRPSTEQAIFRPNK